VSYNRLGDVAVMTTDLGAARLRFEHSLALLKALAAAKGNGQQAEYDLLVVHLKLVTLPKAPQSLVVQHLERAATIYDQLRKAGAFQGDARFTGIGETLHQLRHH